MGVKGDVFLRFYQGSVFSFLFVFFVVGHTTLHHDMFSFFERFSVLF